MTLEEAKKILEKEGFNLKGPGKPGVVSGTFAEYESPDVCEAMLVVSSAGFRLAMLAGVFDARKERLKEEYEKNTKAPGSAENRIKEDSGVNPALKEAASQFNDALLDEQAKKIAELAKENERLKDQVAVLDVYKKHNDKINRKQIKGLGKEIAKLNGIIHKKNLKIEELGKESSRHLEGKMKMFGENFDLEQMLKDKNAVLADVAEELRLSKIREKNLTEVCQKYVKEVEDLREQLADKVVDKIDAQALKSAESALAWKEKVIAEKDMTLAYYEKKIAEKDEVIDNLRKELTENKKRVEWVRNASKKYCDYGVAANEFIKKLSRLYILASNNGNIDVEMLERCKNYQTYGFPANCNRETKKEINDIARGKENKKPRIPTPEEPKHDNSFKDLISKTIDNFNRRAAELGCVGSKDGNGIFDQLVGVDIAEEGGDRSATIVECGKDSDDVFEEIKRLCQE